MRLRIGIAATGAALLLAGLAGAAAPRPLVLGVSWEANGMLARLDARTLRPVGRRIDIGRPPVGLIARSPNGRTIALGHGGIPELRFVDVRTMRATGRLRLPGLGSMRPGIWPSADRLVALLVALRDGADPEVLVIDPSTRRVLERRPLEGEVAGAVSAGNRLLVLLAPRRAVGQARLAVVGADGSVRTVALPGVAAGFAPPPDLETPGRQASPGVAADPSGRRAVVVTPETLLTVDLETLEVTALKHLARRPARVQKRIEGWGRRAVWLPGDTIAVSGWSLSSSETRVVSTPAGATLVQLGSGASRELDPEAVGLKRAGSTLLVYGGRALLGYTLAGAPRFELLPGRDTGYLQTAGRWAYIGSENSTRFAVIDVVEGRVVAEARTASPTIVLG